MFRGFRGFRVLGVGLFRVQGLGCFVGLNCLMV